MIEQIQKFREYLDYIEEHYNNVQKAWKLLQDKCKGMQFISDDAWFFELDAQIKQHDLSKLSAEEFTQYRQFFFSTANEEKNKELFKVAWEHHKINNDHHWQTWNSDRKWIVGGISQTQKEMCLIHNIVDWVAMGFKFDDTAKAYYEKNKEEINLPKWAIDYMYEIFELIY